MYTESIITSLKNLFNNNKCVMTIGLPGCGKTTLANTLIKECKDLMNLVNIERDNIRKKMVETDSDWSAWDKTKELEVTKIWYRELDKAIQNSSIILLSDTNLDPVYRIELTKYLISSNYKPAYVIFTTPVEVCIERDKHRSYKVSTDVILNISKTYENYIDQCLEEAKEFNIDVLLIH